MAHARARIRRQNPQTLRFPGVSLCYQLFPGTHGRDQERGISGVHYAIYIQDRLAYTGDTGPDGLVSVPLRFGETSFEIEIFGQRTRVDVVDTIEPLALPPNMGDMRGGDHHASFVGVSQRLALLGYLNIGSTGTDELTRVLDKAILDFQVNEGFVPNGVLTQEQIQRLQRRAGV